MIIVTQCQDQVGLVAAVSGAVAAHKLNIISLREFVDQDANLFFMRLEVEDVDDASVLEASIRKLLPAAAEIRIEKNSQKNAVALVSKEHHCLADLLVRNHYKTLGANLQAVIGNHENLKDICDRFEVPFYFVSAEKKSKQEFESGILSVVEKYAPDYVVLAKFMRILSAGFVSKFKLKIVNIHHSFLPAFVGANPYKRAHERGVKLIGATAHFVTSELDEGPIIAQQIIPVTHYHSVSDMIRSGREIESAVLANALRLVFEDRVFVYNNKTVVFE